MEQIVTQEPMIRRAMTIEEAFMKSESDRYLYELREKGRRDFDNAMSTAEKRGEQRGKAEGKIEGKAEGKIEGKAEGKIEAAINMIKELQITVSKSMEITKLPEEKRSELIRELENQQIPYIE